MELVQRRRRLLIGGRKQGLDTSPKIAEYGKAFVAGNPAKNPPVDSPTNCITEIYEYPPQTYSQTLALYGRASGIAYMVIYKGNTYMDYWGQPPDGQSRNCINANSTGIALSLSIANLANSYAYLVETGQILFAGKNSIYYGHRNISELN